MAKVKCRYCGSKVKIGKKHHCKGMRQYRQPKCVALLTDTEHFVSLATAKAGNSWIIGVLPRDDTEGGVPGDVFGSGSSEGGAASML